MEPRIYFLTEEQVHALAREAQKNSTYQPPKIETSKYVGSAEALKLLEEHLGIPLGESWFAKGCMRGEIPFEKFGKRRVFQPILLIEWCERKLNKPKDPVQQSVTSSAKKRGRKARVN